MVNRTWITSTVDIRLNMHISAGSFAAAILLMAVLSLSQAQAGDLRQVAALHFTAVSCGPCGGAALAMERLKSEVGDSLCVVGVHYYDLYKIPEAESLAAYYSVTGTPTTWFDGIFDQYYADTATYWGYRNAFDKRKIVEPGAALALGGWADTTERIGQLTCVASNPASDTVIARLRVAVIERAIYRPWGGGDSVYDVLRGMLPGFDGPQLLLAPGADTSLAFPFQLSPDWAAGRIEFMALAEGLAGAAKAPAGAILQSARIGLDQLAGVTSVPPPGPRPRGILSADIHPNPLRDKGTLRFSVSRPGWATAGFYGIDGRRLGRIDLGWREAGEHRVHFNARALPRGMVLCRLEAHSSVQIIRITHLE